MREMRNSIEELDRQFDGVIDITNPYDNEKYPLMLLGIKDFFYPRRT
jgi:hypothetical protein